VLVAKCKTSIVIALSRGLSRRPRIDAFSWGYVERQWSKVRLLHLIVLDPNIGTTSKPFLLVPFDWLSITLFSFSFLSFLSFCFFPFTRLPLFFFFVPQCSNSAIDVREVCVSCLSKIECVFACVFRPSAAAGGGVVVVRACSACVCHR